MPKKTITDSKGLTHRPQRSVSDEPPILPQIEVKAVCDTVDQTHLETQQPRDQIRILDIDQGLAPGFDIWKWLDSCQKEPVLITGCADKIANELYAYVINLLRNNAGLATAPKEEALNDSIDKNEKSNYLLISNEDGEQRLWIPDILFLTTIKLVEDGEKKGTRFLFRMVNGKSYILSNTSIKHYEESLTAHPFARVSPAYLINMYGIETYKKKGGHIVMKPYFDADRKAEVREEIEIADNKRDWFDRYYHEFDGAVE